MSPKFLHQSRYLTAAAIGVLQGNRNLTHDDAAPNSALK